jgi:phosphate transport system substrate-binding protein
MLLLTKLGGATMKTHKVNTRLGFILISLLVVLGCNLFTFEAKTTTPPVIDEFPEGVDLTDLTAENYPRMDGSTSTAPLDMLIACELMEVPCQWVDWFDGSRLVITDLAVGEGDFPSIEHSGTHGSYVNLIRKKADLILVARLPSPDELDEAADRGVTLVPRAVALDAFVFIVNVENPVDNLTVSEIQRIYTGEISNWREVGGNDTAINPYQRNDNSGSQELMKALVMKDLKMINAPDMMLPTMMAPINAISEDQDGIGYSVFFYEQSMAPNELLKLIGVDGVVPSFDTIQARTYTFTTEVYAVIRKHTASNSLAYRLRDWLLTPEGQDVVAESGYVPLR